MNDRPTHFHDHAHDHDHAGHDHHAAPQTHRHAAPDACCGSSACSAAARPVVAPEEGLTGQGTRTALRIAQMDCPVEEQLLRDVLSPRGDVYGLSFDLLGRVLTVEHAPQALDAILGDIRSLGFTPEEASAPITAPARTGWRAYANIIAASVLAVASEAAHWLAAPEVLSAALALAAVLACGTTTYRKGWIALRHGALNINALMSIAVTGALIIGQWPEAAMVMVLFTVAELIEAKSLDRARRAIGDLVTLAPDTVTVQDADGQWHEAPAAAVALGSLVRLRPGERVALDGEVVSGRSAVNQALITGESLPVDKAPGDALFAGTINTDGSLDYRSTAVAADSTLARIVRAVEQAQAQRAATQRFVDRFARIYTPAVVLLAVAVAVLPPLLLDGAWLTWAYRALVLLVIACPCALVISTPVSIVSALTAGARRGILIKGGAYLEQGAALQAIALDKTGTVTRGVPVQTAFEGWAGNDAEAVQTLAASLAAHSDHPTSVALAQHARQAGRALQEAHDVTALPGRGLRGSVAGVVYHLGNMRLASELGQASAGVHDALARWQAEGASVVMLIGPQGVMGLFTVADSVRPEAAEAIAQLQALGVATRMLSGDAHGAVQAAAKAAGIAHAQGEMLPQDKLDAVTALAGQGVVGMVGDGINDAPALARADIGFAMGAAGTGTAIETADVALMDDDLRKIPAFIRLARATRRVLTQNIAMALGIKAVFLALTVAGVGTMWMAVFADVGASLIVVGNSLRLLRA
jgi:Zn2+/Cd2+-exporting ATPase